MVKCVICAGKGYRWVGYKYITCFDCKGKGRVNFCIACNGRKVLWLGGDEYVECPGCEGTGLPLKRVIHFFMGGIYRKKSNIKVAGRSPQLEHILEGS